MEPKALTEPPSRCPECGALDWFGATEELPWEGKTLHWWVCFPGAHRFPRNHYAAPRPAQTVEASRE